MSQEVRVRFAPSPTGGLHIGGLRTALFNYLFARKNKGKFILRIEDTDQTRFVQGAEEYILNALEWAGIIPDESPKHGGSFSPYRQSERKSEYVRYAQELLDKGYAYYAFDTPEELEAMRTKLKEAGMVNLNYNSASRMTMSNSLTLSPEKVEEYLKTKPYVVRLKVPDKEEVRLKDRIRGWVHVHSSTLDDKVILKSDGLPTYHLANVVDDRLMKITHVIRGEEWLPSAPLHVLLYKYLGWESEMPEFAHLPLILKPDGNGKLSKRAADKAGFPIFPLTWEEPQSDQASIGFKEEGFLPAALINFLALLGWNPGTDQEIFSLADLQEIFSLERIGKAGTKFDIEKARWFNQQYLNATPDSELGETLVRELKDKHDIDCDRDKANSISGLLKTRVTFIHEITENSLIFFSDPDQFDQKVLRKKWNHEADAVLRKISKKFGSISGLSEEQAHQLFQDIGAELDTGMGRFMAILRVALTGQSSGPDLMKMISIMDGELVSKRIINSLNLFHEQSPLES